MTVSVLPEARAQAHDKPLLAAHPAPRSARETDPQATGAERQSPWQAVDLFCRDGRRLRGYCSSPAAPVASVLISCGTGFPQKIYRRLGEYLVERGFVVLTYDYRGIGLSLTEPIADCRVDYRDWGREDMAAGLRWLAEQNPGLPLHHVGHSVGCQMVGFCPEQARVTRQAFIGGGIGAWWQLTWWFVPLVWLMLFIAGPLALRRYGYIPQSRWGWQGEPLPATVFRTWKRWCSQRDYYKPDLACRLAPHYFAEVTSPIRSYQISDDEYVNRRTANLLLSCYPKAPHSTRRFRPRDFGRRSVGHGGFFKPALQPLWAELADWLLTGSERPH